MGGTKTGRSLMWLTVAVSRAAGAAAFLALYRLRGDPHPRLGATYRNEAFLQLVPFAGAALLAVCLRRRPVILRFVLAATVGCGAFGWWSLSGLAEVRRKENMPVRRQALGNILPDVEGQAGAVTAFLWPVVAAGVIGGSALVGWLATGRTPRVAGPQKNGGPETGLLS